MSPRSHARAWLVAAAIARASGASAADATTPEPAAPAPARAPVQPPTAAPPPPTGFGVVPFVLPAYQPETSGLLGGAAVLVYTHPPLANRRDSQVTFAGAASLRKQFTALVQPDLYLLGDALHVGGTASAAHFPDTYFGVGNDTRAGDAEPYTPDYYELEASPKLRLVRGLYVGPTFRVQSTRLASVEPGGLLDRGTTVGAAGGSVVQGGVAAFHDTRDSTLYPRAGHVVRAHFRVARHELGSDFAFSVARLDARAYLALPARSVLALHALVEVRSGAPPFWELARLGGGEMMRGWYEGRLRDRDYVAAQAEWRLPIVGRLGAVAFVSAGRVAPSLTELHPDGVRAAGGAGLRFAPFADVPVNLRLDVAYGSDPALYINVGEAF